MHIHFYRSVPRAGTQRVPVRIRRLAPADLVASLSDRSWRLKYTPDDGDLVDLFYVPALECAVQYDRSTGYFSAPALALAMRGIEGLIRNQGHMRLIVGCTLGPDELAAIEKGTSLRDAVGRRLAASPLVPPDQTTHDALELLAWMIASGILDVKVAVPCDAQRRPIAAEGIFHEKAGVLTDAAGNHLAFNGSINETPAGWRHNWESFNVFTTWTGGGEYVDREVADFAKIWANQAKRVITLDVPDAVRADLLRFMPASDLPARLNLEGGEGDPDAEAVDDRGHEDPVVEGGATPPATTMRREVWRYIRSAPMLPERGARVGEATCAVQPWPHQVCGFERLYAAEAPRLLIADEVGLGKTIEAGMLLRQMWLARRARRILILTPAGVMRQWQLELREKFNLNWPIYDGGQLIWCPSPTLRGRNVRAVTRDEWPDEPVVIASSQLMRRRDRQLELENAKPWDMIVLDEAHHARRHGAGGGGDEKPNALLALMRKLKARTKGLVLLTATPMQVHPIELWDLLDLLGLPASWSEGVFLRFVELAGKRGLSPAEFEEFAAIFRATESAFGPVPAAALERLGVKSPLRRSRLLGALNDSSSIPRRRLGGDDRTAAIGLMRSTTPVSKLVSRYTRDVLRRYRDAGKLSTPIADRDVRDEFISLAADERAAYEAVENYISTTFNRASSAKRNAVGFVMTVYRRRLASSFRALQCTLEARRAPLARAGSATGRGALFAAEDASDDESQGDVMDADEAARLERKVLEFEERQAIESLLGQIASLPVDSKAKTLTDVLESIRGDGYAQVMVFTQFTDTMDFLRDYLVTQGVGSILCYSGRGGEVRGTDDHWDAISRDDVRQRFRRGQAEILLCTDAAAEGLNFQFCGALVNYDMPWNPMRVEQRIGRIDRLGQKYQTVRIVNLHYRDTVEADVYLALRKRIGLFQSIVGRLQPILAELPRTFSAAVLGGGLRTAGARARITAEVTRRVDTLEAEGGLDLDMLSDEVLEMPNRPTPALDLEQLDRVLQNPALMPAGTQVDKLSAREYRYRAPGTERALRLTTDPRLFDEHTESMELWSPGAPVFPDVDEMAGAEEADDARDAGALAGGVPSLIVAPEVAEPG